MPPKLPEAQVGPPVHARQFTGRRKVRLGDVSPSGRLRFDALTRYTQDVSDDDTTDAGLATEPAWVVRRTMIDELVPPRLGETITITTFCSGLGRRWAERRLRVGGDAGGRCEVCTLWICVDAASGRPQALTDQFLEIYGPAAGGRTVTARLGNPKPPPAPTVKPWPLRAVDLDTLGHVNNAAYWAVVEEALTGDHRPRPRRVTLEYSAGLDADDQVSIAEAALDGALGLWWLVGEGASPVASALIEPLPDGLYES